MYDIISNKIDVTLCIAELINAYNMPVQRTDLFHLGKSFCAPTIDRPRNSKCGKTREKYRPRCIPLYCRYHIQPAVAP